MAKGVHCTVHITATTFIPNKNRMHCEQKALVWCIKRRAKRMSVKKSTWKCFVTEGIIKMVDAHKIAAMKTLRTTFWKFCTFEIGYSALSFIPQHSIAILAIHRLNRMKSKHTQWVFKSGFRSCITRSVGYECACDAINFIALSFLESLFSAVWNVRCLQKPITINSFLMRFLCSTTTTLTPIAQMHLNPNLYWCDFVNFGCKNHTTCVCQS